jgi:hypothetical protein
MNALAQIFTRSTAGISAAEALGGGASSASPASQSSGLQFELKPDYAGVPSMKAKQLHNRAQDEETNENSCCHDDKKSGEHENNEEPV